MLAMECDKEVDLWIEKAMLEVEKDLSLPSNTLVNKLPEEKVTCEPKMMKALSVVLDGNFMVREPDKYIRHSTELGLRKRIAQQEETISLFVDILDSVVEQ